MITNCNLPLFEEENYPKQCPQLKLAQKYNKRLKELSALLQHVDEYIAERDKAKEIQTVCNKLVPDCGAEELHKRSVRKFREQYVRKLIEEAREIYGYAMMWCVIPSRFYSDVFIELDKLMYKLC